MGNCCCAKPTIAGYVLFLVVLAVELLLVCLTSTKDSDGLSWVVRKDECGVPGSYIFGDTFEVTTEFYIDRSCRKDELSEDRNCVEYSDVNDGSPLTEGAEDDFGDAGTFMGVDIAILCVLLVLTGVIAGFGAQVPLVGQDNKVYNIFLAVLSVAVAVVAFAATRSTISSNAFREGVQPNCVRSIAYWGGGAASATAAGVLSLILAAMVSCPCIGCIGEAPKHETYGNGASGTVIYELNGFSAKPTP